MTINNDEITVSGVSSGGFMAVQLHVAFSETFRGVGSVAGGPYYCAKQSDIQSVKATCMRDWYSLGNPDWWNIYGSPIHTQELVNHTNQISGIEIDTVDNMQNDRVYIFASQFYDQVISPFVGYSLNTFYESFVDNSLIEYDRYLDGYHTIPSYYGSYVAHGMPTDNPYFKQTNTLAKYYYWVPLPCTPNYVVSPWESSSVTWTFAPYMGNDPWIYNCGVNLAFIMLNHLYDDSLTEPDSHNLAGNFYQFDQLGFVSDPDITDNESLNAHGIGSSGYLYVPPGCADGTNSCKLHVALHGCMQFPEWQYSTNNFTKTESFGSNFYGRIYNNTADSNDIIMLYPQAHNIGTEDPGDLNPNGCWEFWAFDFGNGKKDSDYAYRSGRQMQMVHSMVKALQDENLAHFGNVLEVQLEP